MDRVYIGIDSHKEQKPSPSLCVRPASIVPGPSRGGYRWSHRVVPAARRVGNGFMLGCGGRGRTPPRRSRPPEKFGFPSVPRGRSRQPRPPRGALPFCPDRFYEKSLAS